MTILSIDSHWAKSSAFALFENEKILMQGYYNKIDDLGTSYYLPEIVVTEKPYLGGAVKAYSEGKRLMDFRNMCFAVGKVISYAERIGAYWRLIRPVDWKTFYGLTKLTPIALQQEIREQLTGVKDDEHIQDAILIGQYFRDHVLPQEEA